MQKIYSLFGFLFSVLAVVTVLLTVTIASAQGLPLDDQVKQAVAIRFGPVHTVLVTNIKVDNSLATGTVALSTTSPDDAPEMYMFMAKMTVSGEWNIVFYPDDEFYSQLAAAPESLVSQDLKNVLSPVSALGDGSAQLSLPWATGETRVFTGGPHSFWLNGTRPWSSLDFAGGTGVVRAAADGVARVVCNAEVVIEHADGWETVYYHMTNISGYVVDGQTVSRGQAIGESGNSMCGSLTTELPIHLHFALRRSGVLQNISGIDLGGWTITEGTTQYYGSMTRISDGVEKFPDASASATRDIYNDGTIGSGGSITQVMVEQPDLSPAYNAPSCPPAPAGSWTGWVQYTNPRSQTAYLTLSAVDSDAATNSARWTPSIPTTGNYRIYAYNPVHQYVSWPCLGKTLTQDTASANYKIVARGGETTVIKNQQTSGDWIDLGVYILMAGTDGYVELKDLTGETTASKYVSFSAMRFVLESEVAPVAISGNTGLAEVSLEYYDGVNKTTTSDASGNYSISVPFGWSGVVTPSKTGYTFTPASKSYITVGVNQTDQNYSAAITAVTISGNAGVSQATITYSGGSTVADSLGDYTFTVSGGWTGGVTPSKTGYTFTPASKNYVSLAANQSAQNFTAAKIPVPAVPVTVLPVGTIVITDPVYTWNASAGSNSYRLAVYNISTSTYVEQARYIPLSACKGTPSVCSVQLGVNLSVNNNYRWSVLAVNLGGNSALASWKTFALTAPTAPVTVSPTGTLSGPALGVKPTYVWNSSVGATSYKLSVYNVTKSSYAINNLVVAATACSGSPLVCRLTPNVLLTAANYRWSVMAIGPGGNSAWTAARAFSVAAVSIPATPVTIAPSGTIALGTPAFTWNASTAATSYKLTIYYITGARFVANGLMVPASACTGTPKVCTYRIATVLGIGNYKWSVVAVNAAGSSVASAPRSFTVIK